MKRNLPYSRNGNTETSIVFHKHITHSTEGNVSTPALKPTCLYFNKEWWGCVLEIQHSTQSLFSGSNPPDAL